MSIREASRELGILRALFNSLICVSHVTAFSTLQDPDIIISSDFFRGSLRVMLKVSLARCFLFQRIICNDDDALPTLFNPDQAKFEQLQSLN